MPGPCHRGRDSRSPQSVKNPRSSPAVEGMSTKGWRCSTIKKLLVVYNCTSMDTHLSSVYIYIYICRTLSIYVNICLCSPMLSLEFFRGNNHRTAWAEQRSTVLSSKLVGDVVSIIFLSSWHLPSSYCVESVLQRFLPCDMGTMPCKILL